MLIEEDKYIYIEDIGIENIKKIAKTINILYKDNYIIKKVEEIDINTDKKPNILVYKNDEIRINFENIISSVKIVIIKYFDFYDMKNYEKIPENIEYIIINGEIYKHDKEDKKNKFEFVEYMMEYKIKIYDEYKNYESSIDYIRNILEPENKLNIENSRGWTVIDQIIKELNICQSDDGYCEKGEEIEEYLITIVDKIENKNLMKKYNKNQNILSYITNKKLIKKILNKLEKEEINEIVKRDNILFNLYGNETKLMILPYLTLETINKKKIINGENMTALTYLIIKNKYLSVKDKKIIEELIKIVYKMEITKEEIENIIKLNIEEIKKIFE